MIAVRFHRLATREFRAAHRWYQQRSHAAADRFTDAVDTAILGIRRDPESLATAVGRFRWIGVRRFPYRVIFEQLESTVLIIAVAHTSRRTGYWARRK